ncbi:hypothetical protein ACH55_17265, partial [Salmonella enterica subsp. enterica serovar Typhimurium]
WLYRKRPRV